MLLILLFDVDELSFNVLITLLLPRYLITSDTYFWSIFAFQGKKLVVGDQATAVILHMDSLKSKVYVSLREELLSPKRKMVR